MSKNPDSSVRKQRDPRFSYRALSHASAHAEAEGKPQRIPDHPLIPKGQATLISLPEQLREAVDYVRSVGTFAYDSEFIGEASYHPKLCLIQVATHERILLIDPLAGLDLTGFWELLADPAIEKVVHSGQQDIEPVFRFFNRAPVNMFDTQIAAGFIGLAYPVGLSKLVRELTGAQLGKGFTFTHWDQRPLTAVQLRYAADDVRYLPAVRDALGRRLEALDHTAWAKEECAALCDPALYALDPLADFKRVRGANSLPPRDLAVLRELFLWRESAARLHDSPPRSYLKDELLVALARRPATSTEDLAKVRGLPRPVEQEEGPHIVAAVQRGLATPEADYPVFHIIEESPAERFAIDALWAALQAWCAGQMVDPALVSSRQEVARLYRHMNEQKTFATEGRLFQGWRRQLLGGMLPDLLSGALRMEFQWRDSSLRSTATR
jgi:ribonuclease D